MVFQRGCDSLYMRCQQSADRHMNFSTFFFVGLLFMAWQVKDQHSTSYLGSFVHCHCCRDGLPHCTHAHKSTFESSTVCLFGGSKQHTASKTLTMTKNMISLSLFRNYDAVNVLKRATAHCVRCAYISFSVFRARMHAENN